MTAQLFLTLLSAFSVITGLVTEAIKVIVGKKKDLSYNLIALIVAIIVGGGGCLLYYQLTAIPFTLNNIIYAILMGVASGLTAEVGYDKIMQAVKQLVGV